MPLSEGDLRYLRRSVGSSPDTAALQVVYDHYEDEGKAPYILDWVILDVLETRLADLRTNPTSFSVAGEYSQSTAANIKALEEAVAAQRAYMVGLGIDLEAAVGAGLPFRVIPAEAPTHVR